MPTFTRYMVQTYSIGPDGELKANEPSRYQAPDEAASAASEAQHKKAGVVAYIWQGDMRNGETGRIKVLRRYGVLPKYAEIALGLDDHVA